MIRATALAALLATLAACGTAPTGSGREAGIGDPTFGLAVRNNEVVARGGAPLVPLQSRFMAEAPAIVTFPFDAATLDPIARAALDRQAAWMRLHPDVAFSVHGHADAPGPSPYNEALGRRRAEAVVAYLRSRGVDPGRLRAVVSFGERIPLVPTPTRERLNRRAVTVVSAVPSRRPLPLDGRFGEVVFDGYIVSATGGDAPELGSGLTQ